MALWLRPSVLPVPLPARRCTRPDPPTLLLPLDLPPLHHGALDVRAGAWARACCGRGRPLRGGGSRLSRLICDRGHDVDRGAKLLCVH